MKVQSLKNLAAEMRTVHAAKSPRRLTLRHRAWSPRRCLQTVPLWE